MNKYSMVLLGVLLFCWTNLHIRTGCGDLFTESKETYTTVGIGAFPITDSVLMFNTTGGNAQIVKVERFFAGTALTCK